MNYQLARLRYFIYGHRFLIMVLAFIFVVWASSFVVFSKNVDKTIRANEAAARARENDANTLLEELHEKRELEKRQAEKKKNQEESIPQKDQTENPAVSAPIEPANNTAGGCNEASSHNNPASIDVLVNKKHCLVPLSFVPSDLVTTSGATIGAKAVADFNRMLGDAAGAGQSFLVSSSYRSYQTQVSTYNYWVATNGQQAADSFSARPGFSEHQTGLAIDVGAGDCILSCFGGTSQYQWFQANAAEYGFIQRYYAGFEHITGYTSEEWHYRYVGVGVAKDMRARGIKTLEQYWGLEGGGYR